MVHASKTYLTWQPTSVTRMELIVDVSILCHTAAYMLPNQKDAGPNKRTAVRPTQ